MQYFYILGAYILPADISSAFQVSVFHHSSLEFTLLPCLKYGQYTSNATLSTIKYIFVDFAAPNSSLDYILCPSSLHRKSAINTYGMYVVMYAKQSTAYLFVNFHRSLSQLHTWAKILGVILAIGKCSCLCTADNCLNSILCCFLVCISYERHLLFTERWLLYWLPLDQCRQNHAYGLYTIYVIRISTFFLYLRRSCETGTCWLWTGQHSNMYVCYLMSYTRNRHQLSTDCYSVASYVLCMYNKVVRILILWPCCMIKIFIFFSAVQVDQQALGYFCLIMETLLGVSINQKKWKLFITSSYTVKGHVCKYIVVLSHCPSPPPGSVLHLAEKACVPSWKL